MVLLMGFLDPKANVVRYHARLLLKANETMDAKPLLVDVLMKHAMNWVNCECAFNILRHGLNGLDKRMAVLDAEINILNLLIAESDIDYIVSMSTTDREPKLKAYDELVSSWQSANSIREELKRRYEACVGFCVDQLPSAGYSTYLVLFNALLLGMDPTHAEPFQALAMPLAAQLVRRIPYELWLSTPMATLVRPDIAGLRRVTPQHRKLFIPTVLVPDSTLLDRLQYDSSSPDLHKILAKARKRRRR